jgi:hypothetical protein
MLHPTAQILSKLDLKYHPTLPPRHTQGMATFSSPLASLPPPPWSSLQPPSLKIPPPSKNPFPHSTPSTLTFSPTMAASNAPLTPTGPPPVPLFSDALRCRHGAHAMCGHCTPLEPFDPDLLKEKKLKFLPFHAYLRRLQQDKKTMSYKLEPHNLRVDKSCTRHAPFPASICSNCLPKSYTLKIQVPPPPPAPTQRIPSSPIPTTRTPPLTLRQKFRHVDFVEFESHDIVNEFLNHWRRTGQQRVGFLYGVYQRYTFAPLGIKAVVKAIYEPPQVGSPDAVDLKDDPSLDAVDAAAALFGLSKAPPLPHAR